VLQAFLFDVAVLVRHWFEIDLADSHLEHGARVELRLLVEQPHRGTESASQQYVIDQRAWRADLFDRLDATAGGFDAAHPQIVAAAQRLAPAECRSAQQCYGLSRDAATSIGLMLDSLGPPRPARVTARRAPRRVDISACKPAVVDVAATEPVRRGTT
jgi:hypothetical protein